MRPGSAPHAIGAHQQQSRPRNREWRQVKSIQHGMALTERELEILLLIAKGQSAKEAAIVCNIAPRTVETHLDTTRVKLGARNRTHMVAIAMSRNILQIPRVETRPSEVYFGRNGNPDASEGADRFDDRPEWAREDDPAGLAALASWQSVAEPELSA